MNRRLVALAKGRPTQSHFSVPKRWPEGRGPRGTSGSEGTEAGISDERRSGPKGTEPEEIYQRMRKPSETL